MRQDSRRKLSICFLSHRNPYSLKGTGGTLLREIYVNYLTSFGHHISWIFPRNEEERDVLPEAADVCLLPSFYRRSLLGVAFDIILGAHKRVRIMSKVLSTMQARTVVQTRWSLLNGLTAFYIARRHKSPFVLIFDETLEMAYEAQKSEASKYRYLYYLMMKLEYAVLNYVIRKADLLLTTQSKKDEQLRRGTEKSKIMAIAGVNIDLFSPDKVTRDTGRKYYPDDSKVILYLGTMDKVRHLEILIEAFSEVREKKKDVKLLMVGDGTGKVDLERLAGELEVGNGVIFAGSVPYLDVPDFIAAADIVVSAVSPLNLYRASTPTKLHEYMAMAKPVVANEEIIGHREVLGESGAGILVPFTSEGFAEAIVGLLDNPKGAAEMGQRGREWVVKNRSYETIAHQLEERYFTLLEKSQREGQRV